MSATRYAFASLLLAVAAVVGARLGSEPRPAERTYVGQESCMAANCHEGPYAEVSSYQGAAKFRETMHQKIHLRPTPQTVVIDKYFEGDSVLRFIDPAIKIEGHDTIQIHFSKSSDRKDYFIQLRFSGGGDSTPKMKVAYTYGGNGWIERFLVEIDGAYYVPPFQYILPRYKHRSADGGKFYFIDRTRWYSIDPNTNDGLFYKFNSNIFRSRSWDNQCAACHVNGFDLKRAVSGQDTAWYAQWVGTDGTDSALSDQNILIGCESCHGPGSEHVADPKASNIVSPGAFPDTHEGIDLKYDLCNQCHNRIASTGKQHTYAYDDSLMQPYIPGLPLRRFIKSPFGDMSVWSDGITSSAHHQQGQDIVLSGHYLQNIFRHGCWSCHTPHQNGPDGLPYQLDRNWYSMKKGEGCLNFACHPTMGDTSMSPIVGRMVNTHTQHSQGVSQCINCHFSRVISIAFDTTPTRPLYDFSDHSFRVIPPVSTRRYSQSGIVGTPNTCAANCHRNGRGQRNFDTSTPPSPAFGIVDSNIQRWNDRTDLELADTLMFYYRRFYLADVGVRESGTFARVMAITSVTPNPVRSTATINFDVVRRGDLGLTVFEITGRHVRTVSTGTYAPGNYAVVWDGCDDLGASVVNGVYMIQLSMNGRTVSSKMLVQR